ncbi:MAG: PorT family protein [Candidatus Zixiibacteriota bacterium]|nr:MAG: PorT family protein [candidate division Zixibacteria bacterium]
MKRLSLGIFAATVILALLCAPVWAQRYDDDDDRNIAFGIKVGISLSDFTGDDADAIFDNDELTNLDETTVVGFIHGAYATFTVAGILDIQPEVLFVKKGSETQGDLLNGTGTTTNTVRLRYLEVPILLKLAFLDVDQPVRPFIFAGPYGAFLLDSEAEVETPLGTASVELEEAKDFDWGVTAGAGINFILAGLDLSLEGRWTMGLTTIDDSDEELDIMNSTISALLGIGVRVF